MVEAHEYPVLFGAGKSLLGVITTSGMIGRQAVGCIFYNMGGEHRVGPRRINVKLARTLAESGVCSIRFDLSGLGDSAAPPDAKAFSEQATLDLSEAMDQMQARLGIRRFVLIGMCSGAPIALVTTIRDPRVAGLFLFDGYAFPTRRARIKRSVRRMLALPVNPAVFEKLLHRIERHFGRGDEADVDIYATTAHEHTPEFFCRAMNNVAAKKVPTLLLYSGSLSATDQNLDQIGVFADEPFAQHVEYVFAREVDHLLISQASQKTFLEVVGNWVVRVAKSYPTDARARPLSPHVPVTPCE